MSDFVPISLPSGCRLYEGVDPESIKIRALRGGDEKMISEITPDNFEKKLLSVLENVLEGVKPFELTLGDRMFVLIWEAINSYTENYTVSFVCESCGQATETIVNLNELEIIELDKKYHEPYEVILSSGEKVQLRLLRTKDEISCTTYEKSTKESAWLYRYACTFVDSDLDIAQRVEWLDGLHARDMARIRVLQEKFQHGPLMEAKYECQLCAGEGTLIIPFRPDLLFPTGKTLAKNFGNLV